jgi:isopenicillin N synthase-like dioxygenase
VNAIPVIDIAPLVSGSPKQARAVAKALGRACRDVGFFHVSGHGVPSALIARVFETSAAFFAGPASIREAASSRNVAASFREAVAQLGDPPHSGYRTDNPDMRVMFVVR